MRRGTSAVSCVIAWWCSGGVALAAPQSGLRTFTIEKPVEPASPPDPRPAGTGAWTPQLPKSSDALRTTIGLGYVQGADWGWMLQSVGSAAGFQVQLDSLVTRGMQGVRFDHGTLSVVDPDRGWQAEAGDLFSTLRGASRGARLSWASWGGRRPSIALYGRTPAGPNRPAVVAYRDQLIAGSQTPLDAEIASDRSYSARTHWAFPRLQIDASYRRLTQPGRARDRGLQIGIPLWRRAALTGSVVRSEQSGIRSDWWTGGVRVPVGRHLDVAFERSVSSTQGMHSGSSAVMASALSGSTRLFHRYQWGATEFTQDGVRGSTAREQLQSMASYGSGARVNLTLQLATDWNVSGRAQQWEELQTTLKLTRTTVLQTVTALPDVLNRDRLRVRVVQQLSHQFAIQADYGRVSPFQDMPFALERPRVRVMLTRQISVPTPARGGDVRGRVVDYAGLPIAGARVTLGAYAAETDATGAYRFRYVPRGEYDLALDPALLPADYAWDGRGRRLAVAISSRETVNLQVAPLNAIHGRVYCDRNGNGRFDDGEAIAAAVLRLDDRVTSTGRDGAFSFYNVWPGRYLVRLDAARLPQGFELKDTEALAVTVRNDGPAVGVDFKVVEKTKPIIWREIK